MIYISFICFLLGLAVIIIYKKLKEQMVNNKELGKQFSKFKEYFELLDQWMMNKEQGLSAENYFLKNGYQKIAIYGMGPLGNHLYQEIKDSSVQVCYAIDQKGTSTFSELHVKRISDNLDEVDAVVITVIRNYGDIAVELEKKLKCSMISLEEVVCES